MKTTCKTLATTRTILQLFTIHSCLFSASAAGVPTEWVVRIGPRSAAYQAERRHGDALALKASLVYNGQPLAYSGPARLYAQTNGMGATWWDLAPCTVSSNVLQATWLPSFDTGADVVDIFLGGPSNYQAAARIRFLPSPGTVPNALPLPVPVIDFATVIVTNAPFPTFNDLATATNYTARSISSFAATGTVARASSYGTPTRWTDATGCVWEVIHTWSGDNVPLLLPDGVNSWNSANDDGWLSYSGGMWSASFEILADTFFSTDPEDATSLTLQGEYGTVTLHRSISTTLVGKLALTNDLPDTVSITNEIADLRTENALVYRLYSGSNVVAEVTNYNSSVHAPELRLMQLNESNEYVTVWAETNGLARTLASAKKYADDATGAVVRAVAPRAWSKVTSGMGVEAPSNTTWLSTGRTVIAAGLEYEKHVTSNGAIWLLQSNGMTADFHPQTNNVAFLDLSNADGTPIFRVEKTDSFLVGVHVDAVTVDGNALVCQVGVVASEHPLVRVRATLAEGDWAKEEDGIPASLATVTWSGSVGNWTCRVQNNTGGGSIFVQMEYLQEGGTKIVNSAPMDVSNGIICTDGQHKVRPVYTNGTVTWEVVQ